MISVKSILSRYRLPFYFDRVARISDKEIISRIVRRTIPENDSFKILDAGCAGGYRLREAAKRNPDLEGVGLVCREADIPHLCEVQVKKQQVIIKVTELFKFRESPDFDLIYLFEWLSHFQENQRMEMLQYCKMLLKPGGLFITAAAKNNHDQDLRPAALEGLLRRAGFYKVRSQRLTASLQLLKAERIDKNL